MTEFQEEFISGKQRTQFTLTYMSSTHLTLSNNIFYFSLIYYNEVFFFSPTQHADRRQVQNHSLMHQDYQWNCWEKSSYVGCKIPFYLTSMLTWHLLSLSYTDISVKSIFFWFTQPINFFFFHLQDSCKC